MLFEVEKNEYSGLLIGVNGPIQRIMAIFCRYMMRGDAVAVPIRYCDS